MMNRVLRNTFSRVQKKTFSCSTLKSNRLSTFSLNLTDEQKAFQELARSFARDEMMPKSAEYDESGEFPQEIFKQAWELGLVNTHIPVENGGMGLHCLDGVIISEEFAYACTGMSTAIFTISMSYIIAKTPTVDAGGTAPYMNTIAFQPPLSPLLPPPFGSGGTPNPCSNCVASTGVSTTLTSAMRLTCSAVLPRSSDSLP